MNGSNGGAALLKQPELIYRATQSSTTNCTKPFACQCESAIRLGCTSQAFEIADAVQQGGATEITIHGRTKADGYRADRINWEKIGEVRSRLTIPVIANGEIWHWEDGQACLKATDCEDLMVGRGALNIPNLSLYLNKIAKKCLGRIFKKILQKYAEMENFHDSGFYHVARIKQWLRYLNKEYPEADIVFERIKTSKTAEDLKRKTLSGLKSAVEIDGFFSILSLVR